jgi:hypothetical protein
MTRAAWGRALDLTTGGHPEEKVLDASERGGIFTLSRRGVFVR